MPSSLTSMGHRLAAATTIVIVLLAATLSSAVAEDDIAGEAAFLYRSEDAVAFLRWTSDGSEILGALTIYSPRNAERVNTSIVSGLQAADSVALRFDADGVPAVVQGRITRDGLVLSWPDGDGGFTDWEFEPSSEDAYEGAVQELRDAAPESGLIPSIAGGACADGPIGSGTTEMGGEADGGAFDLSISFSCGDLTVARAKDATWSLQAEHATDDSPIVDQGRSGVSLSQPGTEEVFLAGTTRSDWRVEVPTTAELTVNATLNAVTAHIDLGAAPIGSLAGTFNASDLTLDAGDAITPDPARLDLTFNASDSRLVLPDGDVEAQALLNASSLVVCVPDATGLRVEYSSTLGSDNLADSGLDLVAPDVWQTKGFDAAKSHINMEIENTISSFTIERPVACP